MPTRRDTVRGIGGCLTVCLTGLAGCSGGPEGIELSDVRVETVLPGIRVTAFYVNATDEGVTAETTAELTVHRGDEAESYEATEQTTLPPGQNSSVEVLVSEDQLMGGIDARIDATVRTAFPESDREPPTPMSCEDCTG